MTTEENNFIHLLAGQRPDGQLIYEKIDAQAVGDDCYKLLNSPIFAKGAAKFDVIRLLTAGSFEVEQRSGLLCIRVFAKQDIEHIRQALTAPLTALEAALDYQNERCLVYSIAIEKGFEAIEAAFDKALNNSEHALWLYANVYEKDGQTPLNWWHDYLAK